MAKKEKKLKKLSASALIAALETVTEKKGAKHVGAKGMLYDGAGKYCVLGEVFRLQGFEKHELNDYAGEDLATGEVAVELAELAMQLNDHYRLPFGEILKRVKEYNPKVAAIAARKSKAKKVVSEHNLPATK